LFDGTRRLASLAYIILNWTHGKGGQDNIQRQLKGQSFNSPARVRVILPHAPPEEAFAAVATRCSVVLPRRTISTNRAHIAVAAIGHSDQLQVLHVLHHCWRRCVILCVCRTKEKTFETLGFGLRGSLISYRAVVPQFFVIGKEEMRRRS
jgi:hypothetical protein